MFSSFFQTTFTANKRWLNLSLTKCESENKANKGTIEVFNRNPPVAEALYILWNWFEVMTCTRLVRKFWRHLHFILNTVTQTNKIRHKWAASSEFGTYRLCEQRRFRRACASAQSRQNLRCSLIQAGSQEEPSDRKPDPWPLWMAGHAQLKFVMTECSKTQIRLTRSK